MTAPYRRDTEASVLGDHQQRIRILEAELGGGGFDLEVWIEPTLINSWANAGAPYDDIAYRTTPLGLEFKGHITGGSSGTIAFYLNGAHWPTKTLSTITDVITLTTPGAAQILVSSADGSVTVTTII